MTLDFQNEAGRNKYLGEKFDDLLTGINETYGISLLDELVARLENTIKEFDEEVDQLMVQLKDNMELKEQLLLNIKDRNS